MARKLSQDFYNRDTKRVAQDLLGKRLVRIYKGQRISGIIVETEAYLGIKDPAAHTFEGRRTKRNEVMWGPGGFAYIYFIYGMHFCINAVTKNSGQPEAVLLRALQCEEGLEFIEKFRKTSKSKDLANGPGKLCQALAIKRDLNGISLSSDILFIEDRLVKIPKTNIVSSPRIGIDYAGQAALWPLRFNIKDS